MREIVDHSLNTGRELLSIAAITKKRMNFFGMVAASAFLSASFIVFGIINKNKIPRDIETWWDWGFPALTLFFSVSAYLVHRSMRYRLRVIRDFDGLKLVVEKRSGKKPRIKLDFPIECRESQIKRHMRGVPYRDVYLQLIDPKRRTVLLTAMRGGLYGPMEDWLEDDLDSAILDDVELFEVPGKGNLVAVRDLVEKLSGPDA